MKAKYYLIASLLFLRGVCADEETVKNLPNKEETENYFHAQLACGSEETEEQIQVNLVSNSEETEETLHIQLISSTEEEPAEEIAAEVISNYHPYRLVSNKDPQGWNVELDDGSIWRAVDSSSAYEMKYWKTNDPVVIHPTAFPNWAGGRFFLLNERLNTTATVELSQGPILNRSTNAQITYIDYSSGYLEIQDGIGRSSCYQVDYADSALFQNWRPGQSIIVGSNEDCYAGWLSNYSYILINVEKNEFVKANLN